ncbi:hypothetical protein [Prosthecobacter vanneervenii]|uniref:Uncharacterized protein n=1 Tax=Prosthecobacter vanneervenii TaxID=48466 RepID=A0A7W7YBM9_9BACT|nr:hypothetical protein [Prosthecobacter vanneervenii]MBB5033144.1 hypothetical protein [Prosthecobacter vanneervenii]
MQDITPNPTPRERASQLINDYARKRAALIAVTSQTQAEITALTAALNKVASPYQLELDQLEAEAKQLALEHGDDIFADARTLIENGYCLGIRETSAVQVEDEEVAIQMLQRDVKVAETNKATETALACNACLRVHVELDREYIARHYDEAPAWFDQYGIKMVDKVSASLKPAPKPRAKKSTAKLATKEAAELASMKEAA